MTFEPHFLLIYIVIVLIITRIAYFFVVRIKWVSMCLAFIEYSEGFKSKQEIDELVVLIDAIKPKRLIFFDLTFWGPAENYYQGNASILWFQIVDHWYESRS